MFAIFTDTNRKVTDARPATYQRFLDKYKGLGWSFVDGSNFMQAKDVASFMASPTSYILDIDGFIFEDFGNIDNDMSQFVDPWAT